MVDCCPNPDLIAFVRAKVCSTPTVSDLRNFIGLRSITHLMPCFPNPVHHRGVMDFGHSFNATQSHAVEIHLDTQTANIIRIAPRSIRFQKLPPTLLALVRLALITPTVFDCFWRIAVRTLHISILPSLSLLFQQRPATPDRVLNADGAS